ncbi:MAG: GntR family transcriptional regulator [Pirellulales bacterium]|nr:GntR family transcriptional regulator [Pirellulales bacterium]
MEIDPRSHIPIYLQIVEAIRSAIAAGVYRPREALPSLRALALETQVNPNTVQRAYDELEREGFVYSQRGRGLFVTEDGRRAAQDHARRTIRHRLDEVLRAAAVAGIEPAGVREIFDAAIESFSPTEGQSP